MNKGRDALRARLNIIGVVVLIAGLLCAVLIYRSAANNAANAGNTVGYDENGNPVPPEDSKVYQRSLELYGGKANLLADQLRRWLAGFWQGKTLAFTIGFVTIVASFALLGVANYLLPLMEDAGEEETSELKRPVD